MTQEQALKDRQDSCKSKDHFPKEKTTKGTKGYVYKCPECGKANIVWPKSINF